RSSGSCALLRPRTKMPEPLPLVSVVMNVRNGAAYLQRAIDSVLTQTLHDLELVIVDDGSSDTTPAIIAAAAAADPRVRAFRQEPAGISVAGNRGVAEARSDLIARLDADDIALPDRLERQAAWLEAHREVAVLGGWITGIDPQDRKLRVYQYPADPE